MSLDMSEKCQLLPVRIPSLFEQTVLKAVGRTKIEGSCKVYAGRTNRKTNWKLHPCSLASKKWGALEEGDIGGCRTEIRSEILEKCQLLPVRISSLFEQNVLKAVGRTQIEGSCKVYAGRTNRKTNWKLYPWSLASKKWGALEAPWQMTPIRAAFKFYLLQSMWRSRRRCVWRC